MKVVDFDTMKIAAEHMNPFEWVDWVDFVLRHKLEFQMPPKLKLSQDYGDYFNVMPALYEKENIASVKMIGRHVIKDYESSNRSVMMGDMLFYEADTGVLKALFDAEFITTLRTGAVAAHSALLFAKEHFQTISLIGLGNIMTVCFRSFISKLRSLGDHRHLSVRLYRHNNQEDRFAHKFRDMEGITFSYFDSYEEIISGADIVISAVTRATENFAKDECYDEGVTIIPICTMGFQNCDLFFEKVFTDEIEQIRGFKYFDSFRSLANVSDVLNGNQVGRATDKERILVYDYGLGIHDLYFCKKFYEIIPGESVKYNYCTKKYFV